MNQSENHFLLPSRLQSWWKTSFQTTHFSFCPLGLLLFVIWRHPIMRFCPTDFPDHDLFSQRGQQRAINAWDIHSEIKKRGKQFFAAFGSSGLLFRLLNFRSWCLKMTQKAFLFMHLTLFSGVKQPQVVVHKEFFLYLIPSLLPVVVVLLAAVETFLLVNERLELHEMVVFWKASVF